MKRFFLLAAASIATASVGAGAACNPVNNLDLSLPDAALPDGGNPTLPRGVGERCDDGGVCRSGLACNAGVCAPGRATAAGGACTISAECIADHYCAESKCAPAGSAEAGAACKSDGDCKAGLRCNIVELATQCQPEGTKDLGATCANTSECFGGLVCAPGENKCVPIPPGGLVIPSKFEVACEAETGDVKAYFEVPRGGADLKDYFRLPYPNDIRTTAPGKLSLKGFPRPGSGITGYDLVDRWANFLEGSPNITGFSEYPTTVFRFSGEIDFKTLEAKGVTFYVDLTEQDPQRQQQAHNWSSSSGRTSYICPNFLSFRPPTGGALRSGHTYAVFFTNAVKAKDGKAIARATDLDALLAATSPGGDLATAWTQYAPLRAWAPANNVPLANILDAAVFTVGKHDTIGKDLSQRVKESTPPSTTAWTKCGGGAVSPCAQAEGERACPATPVPGIDEYHALITLPLFQQGTAPFFDFKPDNSNGAFVNAKTTSTVQVCAALTVPSGQTGDFPIVVYAHGTGGSFRSHTSADNVGTRMAAKKIAVVGIDQVGHGTRRGTATTDPSLVFFNIANPPAAQGNVLQGAADQVALVRLFQGAQTIATGIKVGGADQVAYWGHSQGATEGAIGLPYVDGLTGVVFSGEGGSLIDSLLTKTSPIDFGALGSAILSDAPANINNYHPVLSMFQNAIDPADPLDHAFNTTQPLDAAQRIFPKHIFVPYGQKDTFATPITQLTYITAANLGVATPPAGVTPDKLHAEPSATPVTANKNGFTAVTRQYAKPAQSDGHFVAFRDTDARKDVDAFLESVLVKKTAPVVPAP